MPMKILVDDKIPYIKGEIEQIADEVLYLSASDFTPEVVHDADAMVIRTRTRCGRALLQGSRVKFIVTATIGFDHIDTVYCQECGIAWANCPGCNANSVAQYIHSALLLLKKNRSLDFKAITLGIVGVGHVGKKIAEVGKFLGMKVLLCDPPRADIEEPENQEEKERSKKINKPKKFSKLSELAASCDIITFHTPLVRQGKYPTFHLANQDFFTSLQCRPIIINTSRGEVIDTSALIYALQNYQVRDAIIDVWENEPYISLPLLERVYLGTSHIAGYSADGKAMATEMALNALCEYFHIQKKFKITLPALEKAADPIWDEDEAQLYLYNPVNDSNALKRHPEDFEKLRSNYPLRREF